MTFSQKNNCILKNNHQFNWNYFKDKKKEKQKRFLSKATISLVVITKIIIIILCNTNVESNFIRDLTLFNILLSTIYNNFFIKSIKNQIYKLYVFSTPISFIYEQVIEIVLEIIRLRTSGFLKIFFQEIVNSIYFLLSNNFININYFNKIVFSIFCLIFPNQTARFFDVYFSIYILEILRLVNIDKSFSFFLQLIFILFLYFFPIGPIMMDLIKGKLLIILRILKISLNHNHVFDFIFFTVDSGDIYMNSNNFVICTKMYTNVLRHKKSSWGFFCNYILLFVILILLFYLIKTRQLDFLEITFFVFVFLLLNMEMQYNVITKNLWISTSITSVATVSLFVFLSLKYNYNLLLFYFLIFFVFFQYLEIYGEIILFIINSFAQKKRETTTFVFILIFTLFVFYVSFSTLSLQSVVMGLQSIKSREVVVDQLKIFKTSSFYVHEIDVFVDKLLLKKTDKFSLLYFSQHPKKEKKKIYKKRKSYSKYLLIKTFFVIFVSYLFLCRFDYAKYEFYSE